MLDVLKSPELQAALLALKLMNRELRREISAEAKPGLTALWQRGLEQRATTQLQRKVLVPGARVAVSGQVIRAYAATSNRALPGGLVPSQDYAGPNFGAARTQRSIEGRSPKGKRYAYKRRGWTQFQARVQRNGHTAGIAQKAAVELAPQIISGWVQLIVGKLTTNAFDNDRS